MTSWRTRSLEFCFLEENAVLARNRLSLVELCRTDFAMAISGCIWIPRPVPAAESRYRGAVHE